MFILDCVHIDVIAIIWTNITLISPLMLFHHGDTATYIVQSRVEMMLREERTTNFHNNECNIKLLLLSLSFSAPNKLLKGVLRDVESNPLFYFNFL